MISIPEFMAFAIDFEGSITFQRKIKDGISHYSPGVSITNTSRDLLIRFRSRTQLGTVSEGYGRADKSSIYWWTLRIRDIRKYLPLIEPFLVIKKEQATLVTEALQILKPSFMHGKGLRNLTKGTLYTEEEYNRFETIYHRIAYLNTRPSYKLESLTDAEKLLREFRKR